jgi:hypothetical protein
MEIVPEKDFLRGDDPVQALLYVFELVDVRKNDAAVDGNLDIDVSMGFFRNEMVVLPDLLHESG